VADNSFASYDTKTAGTDPTGIAYHALRDAYDHFNARLFAGRLPGCLITLQRHRTFYGYFAAKRFGTRDKAELTDEIALNPEHFKRCTTKEILSNLVHEMVHQEQQHYGKPGRGNYHNREFAALMRAVGLICSDTGAPDGKETGQGMDHYIEQGGRFDVACRELVSRGLDVRYIDLWGDAKRRRAKAASKTKYTCPVCGLNAWAKPAIHLICGTCNLALDPEEGDGDEDQ
jgi:hypothetical protein